MRVCVCVGTGRISSLPRHPPNKPALWNDMTCVCLFICLLVEWDGGAKKRVDDIGVVV